jgi:hypothetical protein
MNNADLQQWLLAPDGIATRLRALRGDTTGKAFAATAGMLPTKLSKLENGQQTPTADDVRAIVATAKQPTHVADELIAKLAEMPAVKVAARANRFGQTATQRRLNQMLTAATMVRLFESTYLPRPMQTIDYATTVLAAAARTRGIKDESRQAARILVSSESLLKDPDRQFHFIVAEPVLRWQVLPPAGMRAQLEHLLRLAELPNVDLQVLALGRPTPVLPPAGFGLLGSAGFTNTLDGADEIADDRLVGHQRLMDDLAAAALPAAASITVIRTCLEQAIKSAVAPQFSNGLTSIQ